MSVEIDTGSTAQAQYLVDPATKAPFSPSSGIPVAQAALPASGQTAVTGTFVATGQSSAFTPIAGRPINYTIDGTFLAAVQVERSFDNGASWHIVLPDSYRQSVPPSFSLTETEVGTQVRLNCVTYTSGTVTYRIMQ